MSKPFILPAEKLWSYGKGFPRAPLMSQDWSTGWAPEQVSRQLWLSEAERGVVEREVGGSPGPVGT